MFDRRDFLRVGFSAALGSVLPAVLRGQAVQPNDGRRRITVYKTPTCECCKRWVEHIDKETNWIIDVHDMDDVTEIKNKFHVPNALRSCHTAIIGRAVFEGHVSAELIQQFMEKPRGMLGLAVPGMPTGTPGMEIPGRRADRYNVMGFYRDGRTFVYVSR